MKRLVTLIAVAALLGTVVVSYAQVVPVDEEDTLILTATVAPYGAIWFGLDEGDEGTDPDTDDELSFAFDTDEVAAGTGKTQTATLHFRANYSTQLVVNGKAPTMTFGVHHFPAVLVTDVEVLTGTMYDGAHAGWDALEYLDLQAEAERKWSLWPGRVSVNNTTTDVPLYAHSFSPWQKNGMDLTLGITIRPEIYRWDAGQSNDGVLSYTGWAVEVPEGTAPGAVVWSADGMYDTTMAIYSEDVYDNPEDQAGYKGYLKAILVADITE